MIRKRHIFVMVMALAMIVAVPCMGQKSKVTKRKAKTEQVTPKKKTTKQKTKTKTKTAKTTLSGISTSKVVDLGLSVKWAGWNVGASSPEGYGGLYGWADASGQKRSKYVDDYPDSNPQLDISGDSRYDVATAKWGGSWRLPSEQEVKELHNRCTWTWGMLKGVSGYKVQGPSGNAIFLPAAGCRYGTEVEKRGTSGYYWTGILEMQGSSNSRCMGIDERMHDTWASARYYGFSVRAVY